MANELTEDRVYEMMFTGARVASTRIAYESAIGRSATRNELDVLERAFLDSVGAYVKATPKELIHKLNRHDRKDGPIPTGTPVRPINR